MRLSGAGRSLFLLACLLAGCSPATDSGNDFQKEFLAFGTIVSVQVYDANEAQFADAIRDIEAFSARASRHWYPWAPGRLRQLNDAIARGDPIRVERKLMTLIRAAAHYEQVSGGQFNAGLGRLSELWGFPSLPDNPAAIPRPADIEAVLADNPAAGQIHWQDNTAVADSSNLVVDLGGIAKGAILEEIAAILFAHDIDSAIVNIGGDLQVHGTIHDRQAHIGIRSPQDDAPVAGLTVAPGEAVFTSGNYERYVEINGKRYTHIIDPATGYPVTHTASVTVVSHNPLLADAAATALMVGGPQHFDRLVAAFDLEFALLLDASGDVRLTKALDERLNWRESAQ